MPTKKQVVEKIAIKAHNTRQWLARKSAKQQQIRRKLGRKSELRWWLVYGPQRTGTSYMARLIKHCSTLYVNDWGLAPILEPIPGWLEIKSTPDRGFVTFDHDRFLKNISSNILDNAYKGGGRQLDLVYKQVTLRSREYQALVKMWGPPERVIFCLREPAGYIASAAKKFVHSPTEVLQKTYVDSMNSYLQIKGDIFEYTMDLSVSDYVSFLRPLNFEGKRMPPFKYRGEQDHDNASEEMWNAYHRIKEFLTKTSP